MGSSFTPRKKLNDNGLVEVLRDLNTRWKLQLSEDGNTKDECVKRIRFLYFQNRAALNRAVESFEEWARPATTEWRWKPRQERDTLPSRLQERLENSLLVNVEITEEKRLDLLQYLLNLLRDECYILKKQPPDLPPDHPMRRDHPALEIPEIQGSIDKQPIPNGSVDARIKSHKRKSDAEVLKNASNSTPISKACFVESLLDESHDASVSVHADHHERQTPAPPAKRNTSIKEFFPQKTKHNSKGPNDDSPFVVPPPPLPATGSCRQPNVTPKASTSNDDLFLSFASTTTSSSRSKSVAPSIFTPKNSDLTSFDEPLTQDTEIVPSSAIPIHGEVFDRLVENGPFPRHASGIAKLPLRQLYEVTRIAATWGIPVNDLIDTNIDSHTAFWKWAWEHERRDGNFLPEKSSSKVWNAAIGRFDGGDPANCIHLSGRLDWDDDHVFSVRLNPLSGQRSCRLFRKFGAHRFLSLLLPSLGSRDIPSSVAKNGLTARRDISEWLSTTEHHFLGRVWRAFFVEQEKKQKKKLNVTYKYKIHMFAVSGSDIPNIPLVDVIDWHIPLELNSGSTECKIFQRFSLGLSKATVTTILRQSEFIHLEDVKPVMNDGCARMSRSLAQRIASDLGITTIPSVFQGRIAGAKGLWMVVPDGELSDRAASDRNFFIEISDSQLKIKPHPVEFSVELEDPEKMTFEVVTWSKPLKPASLNPQLLSILQDRGVDLNHLVQLQKTDMHSIYDPLVDAKNDRLSCRQWIQLHAPKPDEAKEIAMKGVLPAYAAETAAQFLDHGFEPGHCDFLADEIKSILAAHIDRRVERLQIKVPLSTSAFCIADPLGVLEPDEVHFGMSKNWEDPDFDENHLDDVDVLVARLPAHLPSDIQKRRAIWKKELKHFKDVIVFPTKGTTPLADLLSGGDYDGDRPWICWDPKIVGTFKNVDKEVQQDPEFFGIQRQPARMESDKDKIDEFLARCFDFNLNPTFLDLVSVEHEKVRYHEADGVSHSGAKQLAVLAGLLVDAPKQGYYFPEEMWFKFRSKISPRARPGPAYKSNGTALRAAPRMNNYLDFLKFWVAIPEKDVILRRFHEQWKSDSNRKDPDLVRDWKYWNNLADEETKKGLPNLRRILRQLQNDIQRAKDQWSKRNLKPDDEKVSFTESTQLLQDDIASIAPSPLDHDLTRQVARESGQNASIASCLPVWSSLRASCLYDMYWASGKFPWYAVGNILCVIKAFANGASVRMMRQDIYIAMKVDSKIVRKIQSRASEEEEEEEDPWDVDNEMDELITDLYGSGVWD